MSADEEMFEQTAHVSDGFGGQRYEASERRFVSQSIGQADAGRVGPMFEMQLGRDLNEAWLNGSPQARRRSLILRLVIMVWIGVPFVVWAVNTISG